MHKERSQSNGPELAAEGTGNPPARSPQGSSQVQTYFVVERTEEETESSSDRSLPGSMNVSVPPPPSEEATVVSSTGTRSPEVQPHSVQDDREGKEEEMVDDVILVREDRETSPGSPLERNDLMIVEVEPMDISAKEVSEEEKGGEERNIVPPTTGLLGVSKEGLEKAEDDGSSDYDLGGEDVEIVVEGEEGSDEEDTTTATNESVQAEEMPSSVLPREEEGEGDGGSNALRTKQSARVKQFFTTLQKFGNSMSRDGADQVQELISALLVSKTREC